MAKALKERYPWHVEVPLLLITSVVLLAIGLSLPLLEVEKKVLWKAWRNDYSVFTGIVKLAQQKEMFLAGILFFFGIIFPLVKLGSLALIWFTRMAVKNRERMLYWLGILGRWSMLDVFVVAILIVLVKLGSLVQVRPQVGVYVFASAILVSMITNLYIERLIRKA